MEKDLKAQNILKRSIKDSPIAYVVELETSKEIYDKLVEIFSESTLGNIILLISDLYKLNVSKDEGISSCISKASQIKGKLHDLGEMVSDNEMIPAILNALNDEQGNLIFTMEKEAIPFSKLCSLCKAEEDRLKKESKKRSDKRDQSVTRRKGKFGKFDPRKKKKNMAKERCYSCQKLGHYRRNCPKRKRGGEEAHISEEVKEPETNKLKKEEEKRSLL